MATLFVEQFAMLGNEHNFQPSANTTKKTTTTTEAATTTSMRESSRSVLKKMATPRASLQSEILVCQKKSLRRNDQRHYHYYHNESQKRTMEKKVINLSEKGRDMIVGITQEDHQFQSIKRTLRQSGINTHYAMQEIIWHQIAQQQQQKQEAAAARAKEEQKLQTNLEKENLEEKEQNNNKKTKKELLRKRRYSFAVEELCSLEEEMEFTLDSTQSTPKKNNRDRNMMNSKQSMFNKMSQRVVEKAVALSDGYQTSAAYVSAMIHEQRTVIQSQHVRRSSDDNSRAKGKIFSPPCA